MALANPPAPLTVGSVEAFLADYLPRHPGVTVDYIHGESVAMALAADPAKPATAILLPDFAKADLFKGVVLGGVLPRLRIACGDRAVLRAAHYFEENARALVQRDALRAGDFPVFLKAIAASGHASYTLCQNVYCSTDVRHQGLSVALALSQTLLEHSGGAWRMQGGGFAGTIQAFVPQRLVQIYHDAMEGVFGKGSCYILRLREQGAVRVI